MEDKDILKKYNLPTLDELYLEFNHFETDDEGIIYTIIKKINDKVDIYIKFLEDLVQPDSSIISMQEASIFSEAEQKYVFSLLRELIYFQRLNLLFTLDSTEVEKVDYFKKFYSFWLSKKQDVKVLAQKAINVWSGKDNNKELSQGYFG